MSNNMFSTECQFNELLSQKFPYGDCVHHIFSIRLLPHFFSVPLLYSYRAVFDFPLCAGRSTESSSRNWLILLNSTNKKRKQAHASEIWQSHNSNSYSKKLIIFNWISQLTNAISLQSRFKRFQESWDLRFWRAYVELFHTIVAVVRTAMYWYLLIFTRWYAFSAART